MSMSPARQWWMYLVKHFWEPQLEFQGNAGAHHADAVDGVDHRLTLAGKDVAGYDNRVSQRTSSRRHQPDEYLGCQSLCAFAGGVAVGENSS